MVTREALQGYVLEEALARLLRDNGYRLLSDPAEDEHALSRGGNGLRVRGRGSDHQVDVLGELDVRIPFGLPVRIFVEAKARRAKVSLTDVRSAHGVVHDVNQHYATADIGARAAQRYDYRYLYFSTSGFSREAQDFARAHQINAIDLSIPAWDDWREAVEASSLALHSEVRRTHPRAFPLLALRLLLRAALGTLRTAGWPAEEAHAWSTATRLREAQDRLAEVGRDFTPAQVDRLARHVEPLTQRTQIPLLLGYTDTGPAVTLMPDALDPFTQALDLNEPAEPGASARVEVQVVSAPRVGDRRPRERGEWAIVGGSGRTRFVLRFGVPEVVALELLTRAPDDETPQPGTAPEAGITIIRFGRAVRLVYSPLPRRAARPTTPEEVRGELAELRAACERPDLARRREPGDKPQPGANGNCAPAPPPAPRPSAGRTRAPRNNAGQRSTGASRDTTTLTAAEQLPRPRPSLDDVAGTGRRRARQPEQEAEGLPWTLPRARALMARLDQLSSTSRKRAAILRIAGGNRKGRILRAELLELTERAPGTDLQGIVRPITTAVKYLESQNMLPEGMQRPLLRIPHRLDAGRGVQGYRLTPELKRCMKALEREASER